MNYTNTLRRKYRKIVQQDYEAEFVGLLNDVGKGFAPIQ
jgi:hypothetical protein